MVFDAYSLALQPLLPLRCPLCLLITFTFIDSLFHHNSDGILCAVGLIGGGSLVSHRVGIIPRIGTNSCLPPVVCSHFSEFVNRGNIGVVRVPYHPCTLHVGRKQTVRELLPLINLQGVIRGKNMKLTNPSHLVICQHFSKFVISRCSEVLSTRFDRCHNDSKVSQRI